MQSIPATLVNGFLKLFLIKINYILKKAPFYCLFVCSFLVQGEYGGLGCKKTQQ